MITQEMWEHVNKINAMIQRGTTLGRDSKGKWRIIVKVYPSLENYPLATDKNGVQFNCHAAKFQNVVKGKVR